MRALFITVFFLLSFTFLKSQNVGIGNTDPQSSLDIKGDIIFRVDTLELINGINDNIDISSSRSMNYILTGPNTTFELGGFTGGKDGKIITLYNSTPAAYYVINYSALTIPINQINTGTGANITMNSYSTITFQYLALDSLWHIVSTNGKIESPISNTNLTSSQLDTSILDNFIFTPFITPILDPLNTYSGNVQILGAADDQSSAIISLPFDFIFDSELYTHFIANSNGFIRLFPSSIGNISGTTHENNLNLPGFHPILAPLWDDLILRPSNGGIWIATEGNIPDRVFHIEWIGSYYTGNPGINDLRFRISISENNHTIQFSYYETTDPPAENDGLSIGIGSFENETSSVDVGNNTASNTIIKNDNFFAPLPTRDYTWEQNTTSVSNIIINTPLANQKLNINGDLAVEGNFKADQIFCIELHESSDENLKRNITPIASSILNILKINPVNYYWKKDENDKVLQCGVIAQEIQNIYPELVTTDKDGNLAVRYTGLIPHLIKGMQEQQAELETLKSLIIEMKKEIKTIKSEMNK